MMPALAALTAAPMAEPTARLTAAAMGRGPLQ
jgi:hypothetical protein